MAKKLSKFGEQDICTDEYLKVSSREYRAFNEAVHDALKELKEGENLSNSMRKNEFLRERLEYDACNVRSQKHAKKLGEKCKIWD